MRHLRSNAGEGGLFVAAERPRRDGHAEVVSGFHQLGMRGDERFLRPDSGREPFDLGQPRRRYVAIALDQQDARDRGQIDGDAARRFLVERLDNHRSGAERVRLFQPVPAHDLDEQLHLVDPARFVQLRRLQLGIEAGPAADEIDGFLERLNARARAGIARHAPMKLDGEIVGPAGGVQWRELIGDQDGEVLVKGPLAVHCMTRAAFLSGATP